MFEENISMGTLIYSDDNNLAISYKVEHFLIYLPRNSTPGDIL